MQTNSGRIPPQRNLEIRPIHPPWVLETVAGARSWRLEIPQWSQLGHPICWKIHGTESGTRYISLTMMDYGLGDKVTLVNCMTFAIFDDFEYACASPISLCHILQRLDLSQYGSSTGPRNEKMKEFEAAALTFLEQVLKGFRHLYQPPWMV